MSDIKSLSSTLNTDQISKAGLAHTLEIHLDRLRKSGMYVIGFIKEGDIYKLPANKEIILFRMCQEALNNIVKHADAKNINVRMTYTRNACTIRIQDDGIGFEPASIDGDPLKQDSTGLRNLRHRALAIRADLEIESTPGEGTTVTISLPFYTTAV
jgi:signal transduction histidine kinase